MLHAVLEGRTGWQLDFKTWTNVRRGVVNQSFVKAEFLEKKFSLVFLPSQCLLQMNF